MLPQDSTAVGPCSVRPFGRSVEPGGL